MTCIHSYKISSNVLLAGFGFVENHVSAERAINYGTLATLLASVSTGYITMSIRSVYISIPSILHTSSLNIKIIYMS